MSGVGAPAFTATPIPARAKSTRSPTTLPCLMRSSITSGVWVTTSAGALELIFCIIALQLEADDDFVAARAFEGGREVAHRGHHAHIRQDDDLGGSARSLHQHSQHCQQTCGGRIQASRHRLLHRPLDATAYCKAARCVDPPVDRNGSSESILAASSRSAIEAAAPRCASSAAPRIASATVGLREDTVALQVDDLLRLRDREGNRVFPALMGIGPNEAVLFHAFRGVLLDDPGGLVEAVVPVRSRPDAVALVFNRWRGRPVG